MPNDMVLDGDELLCKVDPLQVSSYFVRWVPLGLHPVPGFGKYSHTITEDGLRNRLYQKKRKLTR
jgi:hypothetical protein